MPRALFRRASTVLLSTLLALSRAMVLLSWPRTLFRTTTRISWWLNDASWFFWKGFSFWGRSSFFFLFAVGLWVVFFVANLGMVLLPALLGWLGYLKVSLFFFYLQYTLFPFAFLARWVLCPMFQLFLCEISCTFCVYFFLEIDFCLLYRNG